MSDSWPYWCEEHHATEPRTQHDTEPLPPGDLHQPQQGDGDVDGEAVAVQTDQLQE